MDMYTRQLNIFNPEEYEGTIHVIGCGGIGSNLTYALGKLGFRNLNLYDEDTIEEHNIPSQFFMPGDEGGDKASTLRSILINWLDINEDNINIYDNFPDTKQKPSINPEDILAVCVDSMDARKKIWKFAKEFEWKGYVDGRMGGELFKIYTVTENRKEKYEDPEILFDDKDGVEEPCTRRAIAFNTLTIAGFMSSLIVRTIKGQETPFEVGVDLINYESIRSYEKK